MITQSASTRFKPALIRTLGILGLAFLLSGLIIVAYRPSSSAAGLYAFFLGPFTSAYAFGDMANEAVAIAFSALGASLAFKAGLINLGGEGFIYAGAVAGFAGARLLPEGWGAASLPVMLAFSFCATAALGCLPSLIRKASGRDELISSFILSQALIPLLDWAISAPLRDTSSQMIATPFLPRSFRLASLLLPSSLNSSAFMLLIACACAYAALNRSQWGYELRMAGSSPGFARSIGLDVGALKWQAMAWSSGIMGTGGMLAMLGSHARVIKSFSSGMGWSGLACAIVARSNPLLVPPAALLFAFLDSGTKAAQVDTGMPTQIASLIQAIVFFAAASQGLSRPRRRNA